MHALNSDHVQNALCLFADAHWLELIGHAHCNVCAHTHWKRLFKARGVKKDSVPDMSIQ